MNPIPKQLHNPNFRFCKIVYATKTPFENEWQTKKNYSFDDLKLINWINLGNNYGCIGGYGNLRIIDCDKIEFALIMAEKIGDTFSVRTGSGGTHFYILSNYNKNHVFKDEFKGELRAHNYQVVGPNCIHPNGNKYEIKNDTEIRYIDGVVLSEILKPYIREDIFISFDENDNENTRDVSRSGVEFREVIKMIKRGWDKEKIFSEMKVYAKWVSAHPQYREYTYKNALQWIDKNNEKKESLAVFKDKLRQADFFFNDNPFFYDKNGLYWFWNNKDTFWERIDETDVLNLINESMENDIINSTERSEILNAIKQYGRKKIPPPAKKSWIQFKDKIIDIETNEIIDASPEYSICNPIPWKIGLSEETPIMDKLFKEWVGEENIETLYEIIAYCCLADYPIHLLFCLVGPGRNGKTSYLGLLSKFLSKENICSTELDDLLESRFESAKLYKKLVCIMGETNFNLLRQTSKIKRLTGQDLIGFEFKNKTPFDDYNYAKLLISSNSLPTSEDTSEGFYRRWFIINFVNSFEEGHNILQSIPEKEFENLAKKIIKILPILLKRGNFTNQGSIEDRKNKFIASSNPLPFFIKDCCEIENPNHFVRYSQLYLTYVQYLTKLKRRIVTKKEFSIALENLGFEISLTNRKDNNGDFVRDRYVFGICLKENVINVINVTNFVLTPPHGKLSTELMTTVTLGNNSITLPPIFEKCQLCDLETKELNERGLCEYCRLTE